MKYFTADNPPARGFTSAGSPFEKEYKLDTDRNEVVVVGETNLQDLIDSAENACRLDKLLERYQIGEPTGKFPQFSGVIDASHMPRNLSESFELVDRARSIYESLSTEQQNVFGSFSGFCRAIDTGEAFTQSEKPEKKQVEEKSDGKQ